MIILLFVVAVLMSMEVAAVVVLMIVCPEVRKTMIQRWLDYTDIDN